MRSRGKYLENISSFVHWKYVGGTVWERHKEEVESGDVGGGRPQTRGPEVREDSDSAPSHTEEAQMIPKNREVAQPSLAQWWSINL